MGEGRVYPVALNLAGRRCLVVGGGAVAARKVEGLLAAEGEVIVVAPDLVEPLRRRARGGQVTWRERPFDPSDLDGVAIAFLATSDRGANRRAAEEAKSRGVWVNVADDPEACDFHVPALFRRGSLCVAVSTGGASPRLAAWVRDRLAGSVPEGTEALAEVSRALRESTRGSEEAAGRWGELFDSGIIEDLARRDWGAADRKIAKSFRGVPSVAELLGVSASEVK